MLNGNTIELGKNENHSGGATYSYVPDAAGEEYPVIGSIHTHPTPRGKWKVTTQEAYNIKGEIEVDFKYGPSDDKDWGSTYSNSGFSGAVDCKLPLKLPI